jgi:hypothetical protein
MPHFSPRAHRDASSKALAEGKVLYVLPRRKNGLLLLLLVVLLRPVRNMLRVATATILQVPGQGGQENHLLLLVQCQLAHQVPEEVVLLVPADDLKLTINVV